MIAFFKNKNGTDSLVRLAMFFQLATLLLFPRIISPAREFPIVPLLSIFPVFPLSAQQFLYGLLCVSGVCLLFFPKKNFLIGAHVVAWLLLVCLDALWLQPFFLTCVLWIMLLQRNDLKELNTLRAMNVGLYFWAGISKLNFGYLSLMFPWLTRDFITIDSKLLSDGLAIFTAAFECMVGVFLLFPQTRKHGLWMVTLLHLGIVVVFGPWAKNHHTSIIPMNFFQCIAVWLLFNNRPETWREVLRPLSRIGLGCRLLFCVFPALSFWGYWNDIFSFRLYSASVIQANLLVSNAFLEKSKENLRPFYNEREGALPLVMWSLRNTGYAFVSETYFKEVFRTLCASKFSEPNLRIVVNHSLRFNPGFYPHDRQDKIYGCSDTL